MRAPGPSQPAGDGPRAPRGPRLLDLSGLVVGYGLAALLIKAFWPSAAPLSLTAGPAILLGLLYVWLGLAMGGPLVLLIDRRPERGATDPPRYTWAESAWLLIGAYWIALTVLVVPVRLPVTPWLGLFPILAALGLRLFGRRPSPGAPTPAWTHRIGIVLLVTWPTAWGAMILLGKTLL